MLSQLATAMVAASGDIYYGLWYPIVVSVMTLVIGTLFLGRRRTLRFTVQHDGGHAQEGGQLQGPPVRVLTKQEPAWASRQRQITGA